MIFIKNNTDNLLMFKNLQNQLIQSIHTAKQTYFKKISKKFCDPLTSTKCSWSLLKTILNEKKVPCIPSFFHNNKCVTDFKEKSQIFNSFFANQCSQTKQQHITIWIKVTYATYFNFLWLSKSDILQIINYQDSNKVHGHDMINIRMLKLCGEAICRTLNIIFKTCLNTGKFPSEWKRRCCSNS